MSRSNSHTDTTRPAIFEGTDTITQNRKVAVQRVVEVYVTYRYELCLRQRLTLYIDLKA